jgi:DNA-binding NarL/FixJ family response regulator
VLIVDDHPMFLEGLTMLVEQLDGFEVAGQCDSGREAMRLLDEDAPDLVSVSTIKASLQRLYEKLGVSDRAAAVAEAMRRGLIH